MSSIAIGTTLGKKKNDFPDFLTPLIMARLFLGLINIISEDKFLHGTIDDNDTIRL